MQDFTNKELHMLLAFTYSNLWNHGLLHLCPKVYEITCIVSFGKGC